MSNEALPYELQLRGIRRERQKEIDLLYKWQVIFTKQLLTFVSGTRKVFLSTGASRLGQLNTDRLEVDLVVKSPGGVVVARAITGSDVEGNPCA